MKSTQGRRNRKNAIFEAALRCFNEKGYYETSLNMIADEAKLSKGGLYYHFQSKKEIFLELFHYRVKRYYDQIKAFINELEDPEERLRMFIDKSIHIFKENDDFFKFCIIFLSMGVRDSDIRDVMTGFYKDSVNTFKKIIDEGIVSGRFQRTDSAKDALSIYLLFMGVLFTNFSVNIDFDIIEQNTYQLNKILDSIKK